MVKSRIISGVTSAAELGRFIECAGCGHEGIIHTVDPFKARLGTVKHQAIAALALGEVHEPQDFLESLRSSTDLGESELFRLTFGEQGVNHQPSARSEVVGAGLNFQEFQRRNQIVMNWNAGRKRHRGDKEKEFSKQIADEIKIRGRVDLHAYSRQLDSEVAIDFKESLRSGNFRTRVIQMACYFLGLARRPTPVLFSMDTGEAYFEKNWRQNVNALSKAFGELVKIVEVLKKKTVGVKHTCKVAGIMGEGFRIQGEGLMLYENNTDAKTRNIPVVVDQIVEMSLWEPL